MDTTTTELRHESKNVISLIQSHTERALRRLEEGTLGVAELKHSLLTIYSGSQRLNRLYLRPEELKLWSTSTTVKDLFTEIQSITATERETFGIQLEFDPSLNHSLAFLKSDQALYQALLNLTLNSIDVLKGKEKGCVRLDVQKVGTDLEFRVCDNGPGLPALKNGEPFEAHPHGTHFGIGLNIAKKSAAALGGNLYTESRTIGCCFVLSIPAP